MLPVDQRPRTLRTIFDQAVDDYDAVRPGYPSALIDDIIAMSGLPEHGRVLEIGCGTGQATIPFAQRGYQITCVELGPALAARAIDNCRPFPNVQIEVGSFEAWPGPPEAFDLVMAATAFHWIPPEVGYPKAARLLKTTGALAIFSNEHPTPFTGFFAEVQPIYRQIVPEWSHAETAPGIEDRIAATEARINAMQIFEPVRVLTYGWSCAYATSEYLRLLNTYSDHRNLPDQQRSQLFQGIADVLETRYSGTILKPYLAVLYLARKRSAG